MALSGGKRHDHGLRPAVYAMITDENAMITVETDGAVTALGARG
jgi:hypothetical protein